MFDTILVGLDGSPSQPFVVARAAELALANGAAPARLHLVRAMQVPLSIPAVAWSLKGDDFREFLVEHGLGELRQVARELPLPLEATITCRIGVPDEVICALAKEYRADLIVIGSHGYDRIDRWLGTTAGRVANTAPCNVLVVKHRVPGE